MSDPAAREVVSIIELPIEKRLQVREWAEAEAARCGRPQWADRFEAEELAKLTIPPAPRCPTCGAVR